MQTSYRQNKTHLTHESNNGQTILGTVLSIVQKYIMMFNTSKIVAQRPNVLKEKSKTKITIHKKINCEGT